MVQVLVGEKALGDTTFSGYWAEFEGAEISSLEAEGIVYTLYNCTAYTFEAYRVHTSNEINPKEPVYKLHPESEAGSGYTLPYTTEGIAAAYPVFLNDIEYLPTYAIDPPTSS
jgi:hypothetical protein